ncbi:serine protease inhibitor Kazal-type 1 [Teleopsis dalmanni]|uniref:serine protease inhibitor Kazal-type 1 n=1 Tax=Teleopsis dalmanni TaxID=139649 RepID=UPI0018CCDA99|nr:serine protease inhibitor Kazal-type 1 [Teleopsis dalmanni]
MKIFQLLFIFGLILAAVCSVTSAQEEDAPKRKFCPCPRNYDPVCASNMVTYSNRCEYDCVRRQAERSGRSLPLLRNGPC